MSYPAGWDLVNITGTYIGRNGVPCTGSVTLSSPQLVLRSGTIVPAADIVFDLVNGTFSGQIPATDDPNANPSGWTYTVTENVPGGRQGYQIVAPHTSPGIDLSTVVPVTMPQPPTFGFPYVTLSQLLGTAVGDGAYLIGYQFPGTGGIARTVQTRLQDRLSIMDFGAYGDGTSHPASSRFATLASAQVVYPSCTALTDELDMLALMAARDYLQTNSTYRGGRIYAPRGHYLMNRNVAFTPYNQLYNMIVEGDGATATTFDFTSAPASTDGITLNGNGSQFVLRNLMITNAPGNNISINLTATPGLGNYSLLLVIDNVRSQFAGSNGLAATNCFMTTVRDCWFASNGANGVLFNGFHTSTQFSRVYSASNTGAGFNLNGMTYSGFDSCGSDQNGTYGYAMANMSGVVFKNCGAESNADDAIHLYSSTASFGSLPASVADIHGVVFDGCVTVGNGTGAAGSFGGFISAATSNSRPIEFKIIGGASTPNTSSDHALILTGGGGNIICHKELFNDSSYTALDFITGSASVANATVTGQRMLVSLSVVQALTTGTMTTILLDTTQVNDLGATLASGKITIPRGVNKVRVSASLDFAANATGVRQMFLQHNGANLFGFPAATINAVSVGDTIVSGVSTVLSVATGDTFNVQAYQNSGGNLNVSTGYNTWLCVEAIN
ncbi:MAG TPA: right-handed parallel beta-helix repeat-containing protein [Terriglobales bacterium]|nr:right-handed parallel beta-helix repeat-containing protein [Terriglobales bacterium]